MNENIFHIIKPSTFLKKYRNSSNFETECLFGESFQVLKKVDLWSYGISTVDNYKGWIKSNSLSNHKIKNTHIVFSIRTFVYSKPNIKSKILTYLPMRSKVNVLEIKDGWAKINNLNKNNNNFGFIMSSQILEKDIIITDWVEHTKSLLSIPYRWGGRDTFGIDCSALLQLSKAFVAEKLPRDTIDQFNYFKRTEKYKIVQNSSKQNFQKGDIVYWEGHIAIVIDNKNIIHASGFHGEVLIENINVALKRINRNYFLVKLII